MARKRTTSASAVLLGLTVVIPFAAKAQQGHPPSSPLDRTAAQDTVTLPSVTLMVDGMVCPFCAYGLEKRIKALDSVEKVVIRVSDGIVELWMKEGKTLTDEALKTAVRKAGFKVTEIKRIARG